jgi:hypothetical protein
MYFRKFPRVLYDAKGDGKQVLMTDITRRIRLLDSSLLKYVSFDFYDVRDNETPEGIAYSYYGNANMHWLVIFANSIIDLYTDWPMSVNQFESYVHSKYDNVDDIHHYEYAQESGNTSILIEYPTDSANDIPTGAYPVTNYEYEERIQNDKRRIRLIRPEYVGRIKTEFENKMKV